MESVGCAPHVDGVDKWSLSMILLKIPTCFSEISRPRPIYFRISGDRATCAKKGVHRSVKALVIKVA